jgi:hypothetical protein
MSTQIESKLKTLIQSVPQGTVCLASWLEDRGISRDLQKRYRKGAWLESLGPGAFIKHGDTVSWQGAIYAIQNQAGTPIHPGGPTALSLAGLAHYARGQDETVHLFAPHKIRLPGWFRKHDWKAPVVLHQSSMLPVELGLTTHEERTFAMEMSAPERAIMECLYLAPEKMDLLECYQIMEGLVNLRPGLVQELLERCGSVKVKRLFLFMADKAGHQWAKFLDRSRLDLGRGDRSIVKGGVYIASHGISIPKELAG